MHRQRRQSGGWSRNVSFLSLCGQINSCIELLYHQLRFHDVTAAQCQVSGPRVCGCSSPYPFHCPGGCWGAFFRKGHTSASSLMTYVLADSKTVPPGGMSSRAIQKLLDCPSPLRGISSMGTTNSYAVGTEIPRSNNQSKNDLA